MTHMSDNRCSCVDSSRRILLKAASAAAVLGLTGGGLLSGMAYADALTKAQRDKMTPDQIIAVMKKGNERFRRGERHDRNYLREQKASAKGQYPAAVILSCIDSRAPAEVIMDLGIGDIFNAGWPATSPTTTSSAAWNSPASWRVRRSCW